MLERTRTRYPKTSFYWVFSGIILINGLAGIAAGASMIWPLGFLPVFFFPALNGLLPSSVLLPLAGAVAIGFTLSGVLLLAERPIAVRVLALTMLLYVAYMALGLPGVLAVAALSSVWQDPAHISGSLMPLFLTAVGFLITFVVTRGIYVRLRDELI